MFNNNTQNKPATGGPFGGTTTNNPFGGNTQQGNNPFGGNQQQQQQQQTGMNTGFGGNNQQQQGNTFGGTGFMNNAQQAQQQGTGGFNLGNNTGGGMAGGGTTGGNNSFGGNNTGGGGMFGGNTTGGGMFGGNTGGQTGGGMFGNNQGTGGGMFSNNQGTGGGMFGANPQTGGTMFGTQGTGTGTGGMMFNKPPANLQQSNQIPILVMDSLGFHNHLESIKLQLNECLSRIGSRSVQNIRVDQLNTFRDKPMNSLGNMKNESMKVMKNFIELKKTVDDLSKKNMEIEKKSTENCKQTHKKLSLYKRCLQHTTTHNKLIEEIEKEIRVMENQVDNYFKPLFNAYKTKKKISIKQPNDFDLKISYDLLNKFQRLNQQVDDLIACEDDETSDLQYQNTITVFEQLIQYYQNVSCAFKQFQNNYGAIKVRAVERARKGSFEFVMNKVKERAAQNLKKEYKYYDLIKEIDEVLGKKQSREELRRQDERNRGGYHDSYRY